MKRVVTIMLPALLGLAALGSATAVTLADAGDGNDAGIAVWGEAVEVRMSNVDYRADLTRAYAECDTPNTIASDGGPACVPAVSSMCTFDRGRVRLGVGTPLATAETRLVATLSDVGGPSPCAVGPYTLHLVLRVTADDPVCATGRCTFQDITRTVELGPSDSSLYDFEVDAVLEDAVAGARGGSNYEVLGATITGPDDLPLATAGGGYGRHFTNLITNLSAGYPGCTAPDTAGALGAACSAPRWLSTCDFNSGRIAWAGRTNEVSVRPAVFDLAGTSPACTEGTYQLEATVRITRDDCSGGQCTRPDRILVIPLQPRGGDIEDIEIPVLDGDRTSEESSIEVRDVRLVDPLGGVLATTAVSGALWLDDPAVSLALHDPTDAGDDLVRLQGKLPLLEIDPTLEPGVTFTVTDRMGTVYTVQIPAAQWQSRFPGDGRWTFTDKTASVNGVRKATIKRFIEQGQPAGYRFALIAKQTSLATSGFPGVNLLVSVPRADGSGVAVAQRSRTCRVGGAKLTCR